MRAFSLLEEWGFLRNRPQRSYALVAVILMGILMAGPGHCDEPAGLPETLLTGGAATDSPATNAPAMPDEGKLANAPVARQPSARSGISCRTCTNEKCFGDNEKEDKDCDGMCYSAKTVYTPRSKKGDTKPKYGKGCLSKSQISFVETEFNIKPSKQNCVKGRYSEKVLRAYCDGKIFQFFRAQEPTIVKGAAQEYEELGEVTYYDFTLCTCAADACNSQTDGSLIK